MLDLGLFLADAFNQPSRQLESKLSVLADTPIQGGIVHLNTHLYNVQSISSPYQAAIDARTMGMMDSDAKASRFVTYRTAITDKPSAISPAIASCADRGAHLFVQSPFADGQSSSPIIASRAGLRQTNILLAKALLTFLCEEAQYYRCPTHILGLSSLEECQILQSYRGAHGLITCSIPAYILGGEGLDFGYDWDGQLSPAPINDEQRDALLEAVVRGQIDAITSHHTLYAEPMELDPLSADKGSSTLHALPNHLARINERVGKTAYQQLTQTGPQQIMAYA